MAGVLPALLLAMGRAPDEFTATLHTDIAGSPPIVIKVTRSLAPLGADRFHALMVDGFFDGGALFRVVPGFVLQFGISGNRTLNDRWLNNPIKDDPVVGSNVKGTVTFADAGPNTRSSQIFINYADNKRLDAMGFAPFGAVVSGMETATAAHNPTPGDEGGVDQDEYEAKGDTWIRKAYPGINFVTAGALQV